MKGHPVDHPIIRFLQRNDSRETWEYERPAILTVELLCLIAGAWAAPTRGAMWLLLVSMPLSLWSAELARAERSGAARKAERAAALGIPSVTLTCETDMVRVAKNKQLLNATAPIVALSAAVAAAGFAGITRAIVVGFIVSVVRWAMVEAYGTWRAWYRARVPVQVMLRFPHYSEDANERISAK
jgi:hypothetical protein